MITTGKAPIGPSRNAALRRLICGSPIVVSLCPCVRSAMATMGRTSTATSGGKQTRVARLNCSRDDAFNRPMSDKKHERAERRERQAREVEENQRALRESISETERLVGESERMLRRHLQERQDDDE